VQENEQHYILGYNDGENGLTKSSKNPNYLKGYGDGVKDAKQKNVQQYSTGYLDGWRRYGGYTHYAASKNKEYLRGFDEGVKSYKFYTKSWTETNIRNFWKGYNRARDVLQALKEGPGSDDEYYLVGYKRGREDYLQEIAKQRYDDEQNYRTGYDDGLVNHKAADGKLVSDNPEYIRGYEHGLAEAKNISASSNMSIGGKL